MQDLSAINDMKTAKEVCKIAENALGKHVYGNLKYNFPVFFT
jgi:hypothetical protein